MSGSIVALDGRPARAVMALDGAQVKGARPASSRLVVTRAWSSAALIRVSLTPVAASGPSGPAPTPCRAAAEWPNEPLPWPRTMLSAVRDPAAEISRARRSITSGRAAQSPVLSVIKLPPSLIRMRLVIDCYCPSAFDASRPGKDSKPYGSLIRVANLEIAGAHWQHLPMLCWAWVSARHQFDRFGSDAI